MNRDDERADVTPPGGDEFVPEAAEAANQFLGTMGGTLLETLSIEVQVARPGRVEAVMPVGPRVHQPYGLLHGGASVALAETVASIGAALLPGNELQRVVGIEINANHVRAVREGSVRAVATPLHRGRSTEVWVVEINDEEGRLVCTSRCTLAVLD